MKAAKGEMRNANRETEKVKCELRNGKCELKIRKGRRLKAQGDD